MSNTPGAACAYTPKYPSPCDWRFIEGRFGEGFYFERDLDDGTRLRAAVAPCEHGRLFRVGLTIDGPVSDHTLRHVALDGLDDAIRATVDTFTGKKLGDVLALSCGFAPGAAYRRPRQPRHAPWPDERFAALAALVVERQERGEPRPTDLIGVRG